MKIKDVIHGEIKIEEPLIINLIQTAEFQRLQKIKQLGLTNKVFPGAEHTRYSHSIGVYYLAKQILNHFKNQKKKNNDLFFTPQEELELLIACLLHDVGHGPLSHTAETFFNYSHEDYSVKIINSVETEINKILKKSEEKKEIKISNILKFIQKKNPNKALNAILSSTIDADRMDYLLRDSYHTGAVYGTIDVQRIISNMAYQDDKIVYKEKVIHTLEDFILSRYHMFIQVYLEEKSLLYEKLINKIFKRILKLQDENYQFINDITILKELNQPEINLKTYLLINDYNFLDFISNLQFETDEHLKKYVKIFETKVNFYEQYPKNQTPSKKQTIKIENIMKKVYETKEALYIIKNENTSNSQLVKIEEISPIFEFSKNNLTIEVNEKKYILKDFDER